MSDVRGYVHGRPPVKRLKKERPGLRPATVLLLSISFALLVLVVILGDLNVYDFIDVPHTPSAPAGWPTSEVPNVP